MKTKDEIAGLVRRLGIGPEDFACFTRDDAVNALGRPDAENAPVLLTTQQMIISRTNDRSFTAARDFHFLGQPRALRIWDESFTLAEPVSVTLYALQRLPGLLNRRFADMAHRISMMIDGVRTADSKGVIRVPASLGGGLAKIMTLTKEGSVSVPAAEMGVIEKLHAAAGRDLLIRPTGGSFDRALVGSTRPIPEDFAPAIITDASGRVRETYTVLHANRGNVVHLPSSVTDYRNLHIHLWQTACGKEVLEDATASRAIYRKIAKQMEGSREHWLIISHKANAGLDVRTALDDATGGTVPFEYLHWGRHYGTNTYNRIKNVVVIGTYFYPNEAYEALGMAAAGLPAEDAPSSDMKTLRAGEFKHNMLQAILRGNARNSLNGVAGECNVYIVASTRIDARTLLRDTFPSATISDWGKADDKPLPAHAKAVIAALEALFLEGVKEVRKKNVSEAARMTAQELHRQLKRPALVAYLSSKGLVSSGQRIERHDYP
ncbi:hypothetical protein CVN68_01245 [Sphingomonas psychrotolerans]|uniref:Uncharacterized protein n=1 Tax=Sphingomonas psychrotolerans TaxID=1327635 RepID=A0A2K8MAA1_9SPHN|nr:hypothetical protein CVN68_01245 [Sphingomonas psychrotolerans]